jgi:hypothetical protein
MANAITAAIGSIVMIGYMVLVAGKLAAPPLWICTIIGLVLMLWGFWRDDWQSLFGRGKE